MSRAAEIAREKGPAAEPWLPRVERLLDRSGEYVNPILVKETRQALKSQQFLITFALVLATAWLWSLTGLAIAGREAAYAFQGPMLFTGYYVILAFPLLVIVPFQAFRSLAIEQEDRTYELLWISTLSPRQIVLGKLASAAVQIAIYVSAVAPCLAFTYLLRGIAFPTILFMVLYLVLASLGLAMAGILFGTLSSERHWGVVLSVVAVVGLIIVFWTLLVSLMQMAEELDDYDQAMSQPWFWITHLALLTGYVSYFALGLFGAVAQITFASDNRATPLRVVMVVQHVAFAAWMAFAVFWNLDDGQGQPMGYDLLWPFYTFIAWTAVHWWVMGALMTGEFPLLSYRVRRGLPQSFLGRMFLTAFTPGPGTGYLLAVGGMISACLLAAVGASALVAVAPHVAANAGLDFPTAIAATGAALTAYLTIYLGAGLLLIRLLSRNGHCGMAVGLLIQGGLVFLGCFGPLILQMLLYGQDEGYTLLQAPNVFWTAIRFSDQSTLPLEAPAIAMILAPVALGVLLLNIRYGIGDELARVRLPKPERVAEDDLAQHPLPPPAPISPWD